MKCLKCNGDFPEKEIEESHNVPCYLFIGLKRQVSKNRADKLGRHWLCKKCHKEYEKGLNLSLKIFAKNFSQGFFRREIYG